ncbi:MAG: hypothetical protein J1E00_00040 [Oscillospiraceae bacterium]|nr:hypothetical protein [Oscillospiraceae bacterium]
MQRTRRGFLRAALPLLLLAAMLPAALLPLFPASVSAYGPSDQTLIITHINTSNSTEGSAIIISGSNTSRLGDKGNFAWWCVYIFDWDASQNCFVLKEKNVNAQNVDKSDMQIPKYGFAYGICVGNDYSSSGGINYITKRIQDSYEYVKNLAIGTKAYLYNTHLYGGAIQTNGKLWYADDFVSDSYIKIGTPDAGKTAYDPVASWEQAAAMQIKTTENVNSKHYANGDCILFTPDNGTVVSGGGNFEWWSSLAFAWDATQNCYVCVATDLNRATGSPKYPVLPRNGFVIMDCGSGSDPAVQACSVGTKAWLYENQDNKGKHIINLNQPDSGKTCILLGDAGSEQLATPTITSPSDERIVKSNVTIQWTPVEGATDYTFALISSTPNPFNEAVVKPTKVSTNSYTVSSNLLKVGNAYTVVVYANGANGKCTSVPVYQRFFCVSEESLTSSLANKTVLAFGDSLTARSGWVNMLGAHVGTEVINAGVGGDSTVNGRDRFERDVLVHKPDIALICFGMNDQAQVLSSKRPNISLETYTANLTYFVTELQKIGTDVIFICPHDAYNGDGYYTSGAYGLDYAYGNMKDFCEAMRQVAVAYGCDIIDIYAETRDENMREFLNPGDGIHQSVKGHTLWSEYVRDYLFAKYDKKNAATVSVVCKGADGKELASYQFTAAVGSQMFVPAKAIDGMIPVREETLLTVKGDVTITYTYINEKNAHKLGDINGNGKIDALDYLHLKRYCLGTAALTPEQSAAADVNHDGKINSFDYLYVKRHVLGTYTIK